jgi:hypothetical protein
MRGDADREGGAGERPCGRGGGGHRGGVWRSRRRRMVRSRGRGAGLAPVAKSVNFPIFFLWVCGRGGRGRREQQD